MKEKVLLVDDEEEFTDIFSQRMEARGLIVEVANNGLEALKKSKDKSYDAIILDLSMPDMDGIKTLKLLLKENPDLQIIFLTGHATLEKGIEAVKLGAMDFLEKPVDLDKMLEKIKKAKEQKTVLNEKRREKDIKDLLEKKGW